ncbi:hypothetical protein FGE12_23250 [Aggregicoccus sp. 17bor-14]|uniref:hypothetical protein n=1 Tax=Myxococcaceae TaxID=31 RepID=UPI00129CC075|nr:MULTISPECIES: hypothetical protein [Myxococcaceae]MBF5045341.1 hypothetical protein [Simulacricoccus sp. 17bor-14]MRI91083.1 hypothetical protein [Aggregicoccus sp. 17bor-14]
MASSKRSRKSAGSKSAGRRTAAPDTSAYRAASDEQSVRTRTDIDSAVADGQRLRDEIEARIESRMHNAPARDVLAYDVHA